MNSLRKYFSPENLIKTGLIVYVATASVSISGQVAGMLIALVGWIIGIITKKKLIWTDISKETKNFIGLILIFLAVFLISSIFSKVPLKSFDRLRLILGEMAFFFVVLNVIDRKFLKKLIVILVVSTTIESAYGIVQYFTGLNILRDPEVIPFFRVKGTLSHWNKLGSMLGMIIPLTVAVIFYSEKKLRYILAVILMSVCLCFTFTRGGWMAAGFAVVLIALLKEKKLFYILGIVFILLLVFKPSRNRIIDTFSITEGDYRRILMWKTSLRMIKDRPFLGQGPNTFQELFYREYLTEETKPIFYNEEHGYSHPHNVYLGITADMGITGFLAFMALLVYLFYMTARTFSTTTDVFFRTISLGILGSLSALAVNGLVDYTFSAEPVYLFWFLAGIIFSIRNKKML